MKDSYPDFRLTPQESRKRFLKILGPLKPASVPLRLRRTGKPLYQGGGVYKSKILYDVEKNESIPAYLYTHRDKKKRPGIIALHPHGGSDIFPIGKDWCCKRSLSDPNAYAYRAARAGFVVLAPDSLCFGERRDLSGYSRDFFSEIIVTMELIGRGRSLSWKNTWDIMRGIDLLQSLPEVDPNRIGLIGHSGGSIQGYIAAICDKRIKVSFCLASFITLRHQFYKYKLVHCLYPYVPNMVNIGVDYDQLVASIVPRKIFMGWGRLDEGTPEIMTRSFVKAIKKESKKQGVSPCVSLFTSDGGHNITNEMLNDGLAYLKKELLLPRL